MNHRIFDRRKWRALNNTGKANGEYVIGRNCVLRNRDLRLYAWAALLLESAVD